MDTVELGLFGTGLVATLAALVLVTVMAVLDRKPSALGVIQLMSYRDGPLACA